MDNYMGRMREPYVDCFGRDVTRMRRGDLFMARGDFDGQSNPDLTFTVSDESATPHPLYSRSNHAPAYACAKFARPDDS